MPGMRGEIGKRGEQGTTGNQGLTGHIGAGKEQINDVEVLGN
jgi:hypothetical protein